jgi:hypothetical protein
MGTRETREDPHSALKSILKTQFPGLKTRGRP